MLMNDIYLPWMYLIWNITWTILNLNHCIYPNIQSLFSLKVLVVTMTGRGDNPRHTWFHLNHEHDHAHELQYRHILLCQKTITVTSFAEDCESHLKNSSNMKFEVLTIDKLRIPSLISFNKQYLWKPFFQDPGLNSLFLTTQPASTHPHSAEKPTP